MPTSLVSLALTHSIAHPWITGGYQSRMSASRIPPSPSPVFAFQPTLASTSTPHTFADCCLAAAAADLSSSFTSATFAGRPSISIVLFLFCALAILELKNGFGHFHLEIVEVSTPALP